MYQYYCLNPIAKIGLDHFGEGYTKTEDVNDAEGILVRSADMHGMEFSDKLLAVVRAGAGVNNIPLDDCAQKGIVVFNTPGANANAVKELVLCGMLLACRDITGGIDWVKGQQDNADTDIFPDKQQIDRERCGAVGKHAAPDQDDTRGRYDHRQHERKTRSSHPFDAVGQRKRDNERKRN